MSTTYVKMPQDDYVDICDAVREQTGETGTYKSGDLPEKILGIGGGGGTSDYNDLENKPIAVEQASYTQEDSIGSGTFLGSTFTKISEDSVTVTQLVGGTVTAGGSDVELTSATVQDVVNTVSAMGYAGSQFVVVTPSGDIQSFDFAVLSLDEGFEHAASGVALTAGTYIASTVTLLALPKSLVIASDYEDAFLPTVSASDNGRPLTVIAGKVALGEKASAGGVNDYVNIQRTLGDGNGAAAFPFWSQIRAAHSEYGELVFDVVDHNSETKDMTLLLHDLIDGMEFDAVEALCVCASGLAAGTYHIDLSGTSWSEWRTTWQFTLTEDVPSGGILVFNPNVLDWTMDTVSSRASVSTIENIETVSVTEGEGGTDLASVISYSDINNLDRAIGGSGNFAQSAIFKWLNATAESGWWTSSHKFDTPPSYVNKPGFLAGLDADFLATLKTMTLTLATNTVYEIGYSTGSSYTVTAKVFPPSFTELTGISNNSIDEGAVFGAFSRWAAAGSEGYSAYIKKMRHSTTPWYWWQRSCYPWRAYLVRIVIPDGGPDSTGSYAGHPMGSVAPACVIEAI